MYNLKDVRTNKHKHFGNTVNDSLAESEKFLLHKIFRQKLWHIQFSEYFSGRPYLKHVPRVAGTNSSYPRSR